MLQKTNNLQTNTAWVMDEVIKNLNPRLRAQILDTVIEGSVENSKKAIERFIRDAFGFTTNNARHTKQYWVLRGWTEGEAYVKAKENKQTNVSSVYSREFWTARINPNTNELYTDAEADFERNSRRPIRPEYWLAKGHSVTDATELAANIKDKNNKKGSNANKKVGIARKVSSKRCLEYYTARGYSDKDAKAMVSNGQRYFSKEICIEKYGEEHGLEIWRARQDKWQDTLKQKPVEEKSRINRLKVSKGFSVSQAERIILEELNKVLVGVTHQLTLFEADKKQYVYDIVYNNKIIEYNGDFWHSNPSVYSKTFINPRTKIAAGDKWLLDAAKIKLAESQGYQVLVVWERDFKQNKEKVINECLRFLTQ